MEIDLNALLKVAEDVDRLATEEPEPPRRKRKKTTEPGTPTEAGPVATEPPVDVIEPMDPEWGVMWVSLVGEGTGQMQTRFDWTDPGVHWKTKVGEALARISHRLTGVGQGKYVDYGILIGYVGLWVGTNVAIGKNTNTNITRIDGERENL